MTFVYDSATTANGCYIELSQDKFDSVYKVLVYPANSGYPTSKRVYQTKAKAIKGFNQAVKYYGGI